MSSITRKYSITKKGEPLDLRLYRWNEKTKTLITKESGLVLDFSDYEGVTFKTGSFCTFKTGCDCTFDTGYDCTFETWGGCTFKTGKYCTFKTWSDCTFNTGHGCTFQTGYDCTFGTLWNCIFKTGFNCTFDTGNDCVVIRKDIFEVINMNDIKTKKIKLNGHGEAGYKIIK